MVLLADAFATATFLVIAGGVLLFLAIGRWSNRRALDIMDEDREERWGVQAKIEEGDIAEMVAADNERRRRRGRAERSEEEVVREATEAELGRLGAADRPHQREEGPLS